MVTSVSWPEITETVRIYAQTAGKENKEKKVIEKERTKNSTTFQLGNGKKQTVFYGQDVRFKDKDGTLTDYDPSLVEIHHKKSENGKDLSKYQYENQAGDKKQYLPKELTEDTPVLMEHENYEISFVPVYGKEKKTKVTADTNEEEASVDTLVSDALSELPSEGVDASKDETSGEHALSSVEELQRGEVEDANVLTAEDKKEELPVKVSYTSKDRICDFTYQSLDSGVKESITFTEIPKNNRLKFKFHAKGLVPKKNVTDGGITFFDKKTDEMVAAMEAPSMNDASGNAYSEELSYEIEKDTKEEEVYLMTLTLDKKYLKDKDREYPITIDPTVTWKGSTDFWDVYVINGSYKDTNFYDSGITVMMAGNAKQGIYRTYLRFKDFTAKIKGKYVDSANLTMYETGSSQGSQTIQARRVTSNWSRPGLTWSNRPGYSTTYGSVTTTGTTHKSRSINVTQYARECASGRITSYGLMLRNADETKSYGQFYSSRYSDATYRPKMSVTYYDPPTAPTKLDSIPYYVKKGNTEKITWEGITSKSLNRVEYRMAHYDYATAKETGEVYGYKSTGKNTSSGEINIATSTLSEGAYKVDVRGVDNGYITGAIRSKGFIVDGTAPKFNSVSMDQGSGAGTSEDHPSSNATPTLKWNLTESHLSKVEYKVGNGSFVNAGNTTNGSVAIPAGNFKDGGTYPITVRATDKVGYTTQTTTNYYYVDASRASDYEAADAAVKKSYGKAVISWKENGTALPGSIYYEVHRGETKDFTISDSTLMQSAIKNSYCADTKVGDGKTYYYKVRTVKLAKTGKVLESTPGVLAGYVKQDAKSEYGQYLGSKEYRDSVEIATPTGSGTIDKASGNLTYKKDDFDISVGGMGLTLTRTYNSQSDKQGMLGNGWYDTFHQHLYQVGNDIVLQESDGSYLTFTKEGENYTSKESKGYTLKLEDVTNGGFEEVSPNDTSDSVLAKTGEQEEDYQPTHNITVTGEDGMDSIREESTQKTIAVAATLTDSENREYKFDANGFLTAEKDANENFILYEYNSQGQLKTVTTSKNQSLTMNYGENNRLKSITLPDETKMEYTYDGNGNLLRAVHTSADATDSVTDAYTYDSNGWMTGIKDAKGQAYTMDYEDKKAVKVTKPNGEYQKLTYGENTTGVSTHQSDGTMLAKDTITYDSKTGKLLSSTNAAGIGTTYRYENTSNPLLLTGTETKVFYQTLTDGCVSFLTDAKVTTTTGYDANENVIKEVDETGQTTTTTYGTGTEKHLPQTEVTTNSDNEKVSDLTYDYDENGNQTVEYEDVEDTLTQSDYDEDGELIEEISYEDAKSMEDTDVIASKETIQREETDHRVEETSNSQSGGIKEETTTLYDTMGREVKNTDEGTGEVTKTTYDFLGRDIKTVRQQGESAQTETKTYDANGSVASETNATGVTTTYTYDSLNRVIRAEESADGIKKTTETAYGYEDAAIHTLTGTKTYENLATQTTKVNDKVTAKTWTDVSGNGVRTYENGIYTDHVFTDDGKEIGSIVLGKTTEQEGKLTVQLYNKEGKQTHTIAAPTVSGETVKVGEDSIVTKTTYDANGNESSVTDGKGHTTTYAYDDQNRLTNIAQGEHQSRISYEIGSDGKTTTKQTDAKGHVKAEVTSAAGLREEVKDLGDGEEQIATNYTYDARGNQVKTTYQNGAYEIHTYDSRNRKIQTESYRAPEVGETGGTRTLKTTYRYDDFDRLLESVDYRVTGETETAYRYTMYTYDSRGNMTSAAQLGQSSPPTTEDIKAHQIRYTYNTDGNLAKVSYPTTKDGVQGVSYTYDANGWLEKISATVKTGETTKEATVRTYTYDAYGNIKEMKDTRNLLGAGDKATKKTYTYDTFGRVTGIEVCDSEDSGTILESYEYRYDKNSNIIQKKETNLYPKEETQKVEETKDYTYDSLGRLVKTVTTNHRKEDQKTTTTYTYDAVGNRLSEDDGTTKTTYAYNGLDQITTATEAKGLAVEEVKTYAYDANGNQTAVESSKSGDTQTYVYDAKNRLSEVSIRKKDGTTATVQKNVYNGDDRRIQKVEGNQTINYDYQDGVVISTIDGSGNQTSQNLIGFEGNILGTQRYGTDDAGYYTYQKDVQGSTTSLIKEDGSADATYRYSDFGETTVQGENQAGNEVCYTGGIYDSTTGLYYLNARYYNPEDGRFLTEDTYRGETNEPDTWHLYAYCANNPVNYTDPSGHVIRKLPGFPPANQTKYKKWTKISIDVAKIKKQGSKLKAWGERIAASGSILAATPVNTFVGIYIGAGGSVMLLTGDYMASSINKFRRLCKFKMITYFRWKTKKRNDYNYYMKTSNYIMYRKKNKVKKVSKIRWNYYQGRAKIY